MSKKSPLRFFPKILNSNKKGKNNPTFHSLAKALNFMYFYYTRGRNQIMPLSIIRLRTLWSAITNTGDFAGLHLPSRLEYKKNGVLYNIQILKNPATWGFYLIVNSFASFCIFGQIHRLNIFWTFFPSFLAQCVLINPSL